MEKSIERGALHSKPCAICRRRRVKCDRQRPCSNCTRLNQLCSYEPTSADAKSTVPPRSNNSPPVTDADLRDRLQKLESMVAAIRDRDINDSGMVAMPSPTRSRDPSHQLYLSEHLGPHNSEEQLSELSLESNPGQSLSPVGQIVFQEGYSAYYNSDFWPMMKNEIDDLRVLLSPPSGTKDAASWSPLSGFGGSQKQTLNLDVIRLTVDQSCELCKLFCERVNPLLQVVHKAYLFRAISQWHRGIHVLPQEFEAFIFSTFLLTINCLESEEVEKIFSRSKKTVVAEWHQAVQASLSKVNFLATDKVWVLKALVQYTTFLFQCNEDESAVAFLGVTVQRAQRQGHHRDPSHFPYSMWVCEIRRRLWNQICCLDALAISSAGAESCLPATSDTVPSVNANDDEWHASRFAKPSSMPENSTGFTDMTFALVHRRISDLTRSLAKLPPEDIEAKEKLIQQTETSLNTTYFANIDLGMPTQTAMVAMAEVKLSSLKLTLKHRESITIIKGKPSRDRYPAFIASIELLEAIQYHSNTFKPLGWSWFFLDNIPWLAIAIVLTGIPHAKRQEDINRAQNQIDFVLKQYENPDRSLATSQKWKLLVDLNQQMRSGWNHGSNMTTPEETPPDLNIESSLTEVESMLDKDFMENYGMPLVQPDPFTYDETFDLQELPSGETISWDNAHMQL